MKSFKILVSLFLTILLVGCGGRVQPVMEIQDTPVGHELQNKQVKNAILLAASKRGWNATETKNGVIQAQLYIRSHFAEVMITYDEKYYSILYVKSENLKASDGKIHRNYNRWINNLNSDIRRELAKAASL